MQLAALVVGLIACAAIIVLGIRFFLQPRQATLDFGIAADNLRGLTAIKLIVLTNGGELSRALGIHGVTAGLLVATGLVLALG